LIQIKLNSKETDQLQI